MESKKFDAVRLSQLVYAASNVNVPNEIIYTIKAKLFSFLWNNKKDKMKRENIYQDYDRGGIRMTDVDIMIKALRLAWIPRLLNPISRNWKSIPDYFFKKLGGFNFLLRCNYDAKYLNPKLPAFYKDILSFFSQFKSQYNYEQGQEIILFNNKAILIDRKPFFFWEWFSKGIICINDLLNENGKFLSFQEFQSKYDFRTNFLNFYQVINAIPKALVIKARTQDKPPKENFLGNRNTKFKLAENIDIDLQKIKAKDFYWLLNEKTNDSFPTGPKKWSKIMNLNFTKWRHIFKVAKQICRENKLKEFHYKFALLPTSSIANKTLLRKLNYTLLFMRYYIYSSKLHNRSITLSDFVTKLKAKYNVENIDSNLSNS